MVSTDPCPEPSAGESGRVTTFLREDSLPLAQLLSGASRRIADTGMGENVLPLYCDRSRADDEPVEPELPKARRISRYAPTIAKYTRSVALAECGKPYIDAYRVQGMGGLAICVRHLVPNMARSLVGYLVVLFGEGLMSLATLSFLGAGLPSETPSWGNLMADGRAYFLLFPGLILYPGIILALTLLSVNVLGDVLRDVLDPRMGKK